jgi:hypothetical protein
MARTSSAYPVSAPYRPGLKPAVPPRRSRRWALALCGVGAVLLLAGVAGGVIWVNRANAESSSGTTEAEAPPARPERFLETVGSLSAGHLYQSFLNIGLLADCVENETYTPEQAEKMLRTVLRLIDLQDHQLFMLKESGLDGEDSQTADRIRSVADALRSLANTLQAYWETGDEADLQQYLAEREDVRTGLLDLLSSRGAAP